MNRKRWVQRITLTGAAGLTVAAMMPTGAHAAAAPPQTYSAAATANGVEYAFDRKPGLSQVSDVVHGVSPYATSTLGVGGVSQGKAATVYMGGLEGVPGLICVAAGSPAPGQPPYCSQFPFPGPPSNPVPAQGNFPPAFPFEADAQYPSQQTAEAPVQGKQIGGAGAPFAANQDSVTATAHLLSAGGNATDSSTSFFAHTVTTGSSNSTTSQSVNAKGAVVTKAESVINDINVLQVPHVGPFIHIGAVHSTVQITYDGTHKADVVNQTTVSGVSVAGLPATIDQNGIHIVNQSNATALDVLNKQLAFLLNANYMTISVIGATTTTGDHAVQAQSAGLLLNFDDTVSGAPKAPPVTDIPKCKLLKPLQTFFDKNGIPVVLCTPPQPPDVNAEYFGTVSIGNVGTTVTAANYSFLTQLPGANTGGILPGAGGPISTFVPGTSGTPGSAGSPGLTGTSIAPTGPAQPQVAGPGHTVGYLENLGDAAKRLKYLFPALLLAVIGILAGRIGRAPARLPRATT